MWAGGGGPIPAIELPAAVGRDHSMGIAAGRLAQP